MRTSLVTLLTRSRAAGWLAAAAAVLVLAPVTAADANVGFVDASFTGASAPSGMKPQSKLWVADGIWWGAMFNAFTQRYEIYRRTAGTETWASTGTVIDGRRIVWTDAKWDGSHLTVLSHGASGTETLDGIRVSRYSYDGAAKTWSLDDGFPVTNVGTTPGHGSSTGTEGAVLDTDGGGRIWITWTRDQKVWVTHSTTDAQTFSTPIVVPAPNADNLSADDMSTLVAFDGRIGVLWSNQNVMCMCFAVHADGDPDSAWTSRPLAAPAANPADRAQQLADDHMNLKAPNDGSGRIYAITKTSTNALEDPLLLFSTFDGANWTSVTAARVADDVTRAQITLDMQHNVAHLFAAGPCCEGGVVYHKQTSLIPGHVGFQDGRGEPFIQNAAHPTINNPSTTKQPGTSSTGVVVIASDDHTKRYLHNTLDLSLADTTAPDTSITSGPTGNVNNADARFEFASTEPGGSRFECSLDASGAYEACSSPKTYASLANGGHTFRVRAVDLGSNADPTPATRTWTVEDTTTTLDVPAEADTYATSASPNTNYGTKPALNIDKSSTADPSDKQAFLRFAVSGTRKIVSAKLRLWVTDGSVEGPSIFSTATGWGEGTLTFANRPAAIGAALATNPAAVAKNVWLEYDVTAAVVANGTYGFTATTASGDGLAVASREATTVGTRPVLRLRVNPSPDTEIKSAPAAVVNSTVASFSFASNQADATFDCKSDNGTYAACATPVSYGGLADGAHTFSVRAKDGSGVVDPTPAIHTWTVDTVGQAAPTIALTTASDTGASSTDRITADTRPSFAGRAQPGSLVALAADGIDLGNAPADAAGDWIFNSDDLAPGAQTITATATDGAGNESAPSSLTIVIDTTPPSPPAITNPSADLVTASPNLTVAGAAAAGVRVELLDGAGTVAATTADGTDRWSIAVTGLSDGSHALGAMTRDVAGNASAPVTRTITVDTVAPDTTITTGPADPTADTTASFVFSSSQDGSTFACRLDGGAFSACTSPKTYTVADGAHTVEVLATDAAGNAGASAASWSWTVQGGLPSPPLLTKPADGAFVASSTVTVAGTAQPGASVVVLEDSVSQGTATADLLGSWSVGVTALADGEHTFSARATNSSGTSAPSSARTITVDTRAPQTTIGSGPANPANTATATFAFGADEPGATYECRLDSGSYAACSSPRVLTGLADGSHVFFVKATDRAANADATPASVTWTVDTIAPDTTITAGPSGVVESSSASFAFSATGAATTFACSLDGGPYSSCASPHDLTGLSSGGHMFDVKAADAAGNVDATPASRTWQIQQSVLSDGFESGNLSKWLVGTGGDGTAVVQTDTVKTGVYAARLTATANIDSFARLRFSLPAPRNDVTVDEDIRIDAQGASGGNVPLLRIFDSGGNRLLSLYRQNVSTGTLHVSFGNPATTVSLGKTLAIGTWVGLRVRVVTAPGSGGSVTITMNGVQIYATAQATLGTAGISGIQIGNDTKKQAFSLAADNVIITQR